MSSLKRRGMLVLLLVSIVAGFPTHATAQVRIRMEYPVDRWIAPSSWYDLVLDCNGGDTILGDFEVTEGVSVDFLLIDDAKFDLWSRGFSIDANVHKENVTSHYAWDYEVAAIGQYHIVFHNHHVAGQAHVEGTVIHIGAPFVAQLLFSSLTIGIVVLILGAGIFIHRRLR